MSASWTVADLPNAIHDLRLPTVTFYNRLEGRPRTHNFERALRGEVRDGLWMLTRQWQTGEFAGDDAGSPVQATVHTEIARLRHYRAGQHAAEPFNDAIPLEAQVEARPITWTRDGHDISLDLRLLLGRQWLRMLRPLGDFDTEFIARWPIHQPIDHDVDEAEYLAHAHVLASFRAVAGRRMDGAQLLAHLTGEPAGDVADGIPSLATADAQLRDDVAALAARFVEWSTRLMYQPGRADAWIPERLEYQFATSAPTGDGERVFVAEEYAHGHLDWHNLDVDPDAVPLGDVDADVAPVTRVMLPAPLEFDGMPNARWWSFEDGRINLGGVRPDTTDLGKLLLLEFAMMYANDWFLIPSTLPAGSVAQVRGLAVTNVFGERTWIEATGSGDSAADQQWSMFSPTVTGNGDIGGPMLVALPTAVTVSDSQPSEEVVLLRDEVANMVWAVEKTVPLASGEAVAGAEAARETRAFYKAQLTRRLGAAPQPPPLADDATDRYEVMTSVPEHWLPFVAVRVPGSNREVQLRRAAMPRLIDGDDGQPQPVRPRTSLMRHGLDQDTPSGYLLHEEEVPRAGIRVTRGFERTRWRDGRVWIWEAVRKQTGTGVGASYLAFDQLRRPE